MLRHLIASCEAAFDKVVVVLGSDMDLVAKEAAPHTCVIQHERLGLPMPRLQAVEHFGSGEVAVLYADNPLIRPETMRRLLERRQRGDCGLALLAFRPADPARYGRVIVQHDHVARIVEWADATEAERSVDLCNAGVLCADAADMARWLMAVRADNAKGEYYLTDVVALAHAEQVRVAAVEAPAEELRGVNSRVELAPAEAVVQGWLRHAAMEAGVTMIDPSSVFLRADTQFEPDVTIEPNVVFGDRVKVARGAVIRAFSHLDGCAVGPDCIIGPFARLRPGTVLEHDVHIGNFVEVKARTLGGRGEGQPFDLSGRCLGRCPHQYRRRNHHLQLRRLSTNTARRSAPMRSSARTWRWWRRFGGRRRHRRRRQRDYRERGAGRPGPGQRQADAETEPGRRISRGQTARRATSQSETREP